MKRAIGWYWVKTNRLRSTDWKVAYWNGSYWVVPSAMIWYGFGRVGLIGPRIEEPKEPPCR